MIVIRSSDKPHRCSVSCGGVFSSAILALVVTFLAWKKLRSRERDCFFGARILEFRVEPWNWFVSLSQIVRC